MADLAQLQTWKSEAEAAMNRLMTGSMVEEIVGPNNTKTRFMLSDSSKLQGYIAYLDQQISTALTGRRHRPIFFSPKL